MESFLKVINALLLFNFGANFFIGKLIFYFRKRILNHSVKLRMAEQCILIMNQLWSTCFVPPRYNRKRCARFNNCSWVNFAAMNHTTRFTDLAARCYCFLVLFDNFLNLFNYRKERYYLHQILLENHQQNDANDNPNPCCKFTPIFGNHHCSAQHDSQKTQNDSLKFQCIC